MAQTNALLDGKQVTIDSSPKGKLTFLDFTKGLLLTGISAASTGAVELLSNLVKSGTFTMSKDDFLRVAAVSGIAMFSYLAKQISTETKIVKVQDQT